jgi:hypothetical protein
MLRGTRSQEERSPGSVSPAHLATDGLRARAHATQNKVSRNLEGIWLRDESREDSESLPPPDYVTAREIMEDPGAAAHAELVKIAVGSRQQRRRRGRRVAARRKQRQRQTSPSTSREAESLSRTPKAHADTRD